MTAQPSSSALSQFQLAASELRRDRADLNARLDRLSRLCAETEKLIAESKARIVRSLAVVDSSPNLVPDSKPAAETRQDRSQQAELVRD
jgi:hypothetical protein